MSAPDWFGLFDTSEPLEQGVILFGFKYLDVLSNKEAVLKGEAEADAITNDVIILTQSCDLAEEVEDQHVHVCPIYTLKDAFTQFGYTASGKKREFFNSVKKQQRIDKFLTNKCNIKTFGPKYTGEYLLVAFDMAAVIPSSYIRLYAKNAKRRLILKSPYREALAQAYGRYFMRVGNPTNIEDLNISDYPES